MAGKMVFGTAKLGRQRRVITCDASTFDGCEWMPNFKGSQRGCVLKVSNEGLRTFGIKKRSQIDAINGTDHSNHGFKKIRKILNENLKSGEEFSVTIMTGELTVKTVEIFFRGAFCPSVEFCAEGDGTNFIIENIPYDDNTKVLIDKCSLSRGWRVAKVKNTKVSGKKYEEISKMILSASNDMRVDYSVVFEEGDMSWYNFEEPPQKKKETKHQRKGSGRVVHIQTKKRTSRNIKPKGKRQRKKSHHASSNTVDMGSLAAMWSKDIKQREKDKTAENIPRSGHNTPVTPVPTALESLTEGKTSFDEGKTSHNTVSKKPTLQVIHSGGLHIDSDVNAIVSDANISPVPLPIVSTHSSDHNTTKHSKKKSVSFGDILKNNKGKQSVNTPTKSGNGKERNKSVPKMKLEKKVETIEEIIKIEPIDVNVICDLCEKDFVIKDNELKYYSLNTIENKTIDTAENGDNEEKIEHKEDIKYNGICKECIQWQCTVELNKPNSIMLAPHCSGNGVEICYVDPQIDKYITWIDDEKKKDDEKGEENNKKKKKKVREKHMKITKHFRILAINDVDVECESLEVIFAMYYQPINDDKKKKKKKKQNKIKLKLKKHFNEDHLKIVETYYLHENELLSISRKAEEERKAEEAKKALLTRNTNKTMVDSDPSDDAESDSDDDNDDINDRSNRRNVKKRGKKWKSKSMKNLRSDYYDSTDYNDKSVSQLIEEHDGMIFIHEAEKFEAEQEWEMAGINYEKGVNMLEDYQKTLHLRSAREKREYRQCLAEYRRKMLLIQNRLIRRTNTPRHSNNRDRDKDKDIDKDKDDKDKDEGDNDNNKKKKEKINERDKALFDKLTADIITEAPNISFKDVTGLLNVKLALYECVILPQKRPELFTGLRKPTAGLLLFGPPGNGKTMIAKCVATECDATFFSISASSITSKWVGEAERTMRTLFNLAREKQPSIIFIDEIDSLLTQRGGNNEAESSRRIKTEFLVQFDGVKASADGAEARILVIGATNLPDQLDEAVLRRFGKRILVPVPDEDARYGILRNLTAKQSNNISEEGFKKIVQKTNLYSASDLTQVCKDASMGPLRDLGSAVLDDETLTVPPIQMIHFESALKNVRASVKEESLIAYQKWDSKFGSKLTFALSALPQNMHAHVIEPLNDVIII